MFSAENKSEASSPKSEIFVFHPDEILGRSDLKNRRIKVKNIFKNIEFKKNFEDINRLILAKIKNKYRISPQYAGCVKEMWHEFKGKIISGSTALLVLAAVCLCANALDLRLGYEVILDGETVGLVTETFPGFSWQLIACILYLAFGSGATGFGTADAAENQLPTHEGMIVITAKEADFDYKTALSLDNDIELGGPTTFENITLSTRGANPVLISVRR